MKKSPTESLAKFFLIYLRLILTPFTNGRFAIFKMLFLIAILGTINVFLPIIETGDFTNVKNAHLYERPSILYGLNSKNEFEPIAEFYKFSRVIVNLDEYKNNVEKSKPGLKKLVQSYLSTEDSNFFSHFGVDIRGIIRAFAVNIIAGKIKEGASTITQQVARLKFLNTERTYFRKAREAWLAMLMERHYDKHSILEMYLNEIPLGHGTLGAGAAARFYFRKDVGNLSWGEAALLSSLTTRPKQFSPLVNPSDSSRKVRVVFMKLIETGAIDIKTAEDEYKKFSNYYVSLNRSPNDSAFADRLNRFPYFTEYIRRILKSDKNIEKKIYNGGLKIYSTLQIDHQIAAENALNAALEKLNKASLDKTFKNVEVFDHTYGGAYDVISLINDLPEFKYKIKSDQRTFRNEFLEDTRDNLNLLNSVIGLEEVADVLDKNFGVQSSEDYMLPIEGSIISMRPNTGYITAIVGGSGFRSDNQNIRSIQAFRQPGSAFKPLLYASAIDHYGRKPEEELYKNITASTIFLDSPIQFLLEDGDEWSPENYSNEYSGFIRLRAALESSKNSVAVRLIEQVGLSKVIPTIKALMHIDNREIPLNYSVSLGTFEITPFDLTRAYTVFASKGREVHPLAIQYITESDGKMFSDYRIEHKKKLRKQIISQETSYIITTMLRDVVAHGTARAILHSGLNRYAVGKTGTTNNFRDAWFVGYTAELVSSVWFGYDVGTISLGKGMAGGVIATPVWAEYMKNALQNEEKKELKFKMDNILSTKVCSITGKVAGPKCGRVYTEHFIKGTLDPTVCNDHRLFLPDINFTEKLVEDIKTSNKTNKKKPLKNEAFDADDIPD